MIVNTRYIKALRAYHGLSQTELAEVLNSTFQTYNKKENGKTNFSLEELKSLANFFDIPLENFFKEEVAI